MKIARASALEQVPLFELRPDFPIRSNAHARNAYGTAAQLIVCAALGLAAIPIDGRFELCFDAERDGSFFEIKSVKRGCKVVAYDWRMKKEAAAGVPAFYAVLFHRVRGARSNAELWRQLAAGGLSILVVPLERFHALAFAEPLRQMKTTTDFAQTRCGYNRAGYCEGYRNVPTARLMDGAGESLEVGFEVFGETMRAAVFGFPLSVGTPAAI